MRKLFGKSSKTNSSKSNQERRRRFGKHRRMTMEDWNAANCWPSLLSSKA